MLPVCGVAAVCTAYAVGAARPVSTAASATAAAQRRPPRGTSSASAVTPAVATITQRSQGRNSAARPSSTQAQAAVPATRTAAVIRPAHVARCCHSWCPPMPISAAIPGASATV
jgi:hypothetical protein